MCRWQLLLERGLDVVGHLQLNFTASCANGTHQGLLALAPGLRGGAFVVSALARPRSAVARAELNHDGDDMSVSAMPARAHRQGNVTSKG